MPSRSTARSWEALRQAGATPTGRHTCPLSCPQEPQTLLAESGRQDLNLRPPGPQPGALPDCATPRGRPESTRVRRRVERTSVRGRTVRPRARRARRRTLCAVLAERCQTDELVQRAGDENRTRALSLEGSRAAVTPRSL